MLLAVSGENRLDAISTHQFQPLQASFLSLFFRAQPSRYGQRSQRPLIVSVLLHQLNQLWIVGCKALNEVEIVSFHSVAPVLRAQGPPVKIAGKDSQQQLKWNTTQQPGTP
tara:strand:+ start:788 stop:1120 length:333 start_codon:yes stop_codon:yes gene_type:complete